MLTQDEIRLLVTLIAKLCCDHNEVPKQPPVMGTRVKAIDVPCSPLTFRCVFRRKRTLIPIQSGQLIGAKRRSGVVIEKCPIRVKVFAALGRSEVGAEMLKKGNWSGRLRASA